MIAFLSAILVSPSLELGLLLHWQCSVVVLAVACCIGGVALVLLHKQCCVGILVLLWSQWHIGIVTLQAAMLTTFEEEAAALL